MCDTIGSVEHHCPSNNFQKIVPKFAPNKYIFLQIKSHKSVFTRIKPHKTHEICWNTVCTYVHKLTVRLCCNNLSQDKFNHDLMIGLHALWSVLHTEIGLFPPWPHRSRVVSIRVIQTLHSHCSWASAWPSAKMNLGSICDPASPAFQISLFFRSI